MLYFLTSNNDPDSQQKDGQESNQIFSRINLIATTPKGFALLVLGVLATSLFTFVLGFASGKWAATSETKSELAGTSISNMPRQFPPPPPDASIPSDKPSDTEPPSTAPSGSPRPVLSSDGVPLPPVKPPSSEVRPAIPTGPDDKPPVLPTIPFPPPGANPPRSLQTAPQLEAPTSEAPEHE